MVVAARIVALIVLMVGALDTVEHMCGEEDYVINKWLR